MGTLCLQLLKLVALLEIFSFSVQNVPALHSTNISTTYGGTNSNALLVVETEDNSEAGTVEKAVLAGVEKETLENVRPDEESASRWL